MATYDWLGGSTDFEAGGSWRAYPGGATGTAPTTDTARFPAGDDELDTNMNQSGSNQVNVIVGEEWAGKIGTASTPLQLGSMTGYLEYRSSKGEGHFAPTGCTTARVYDTPDRKYGFHVQGGTITNLYALGGSSVWIGAGATVTNLFVSTVPGRPRQTVVFIESGASVTTAHLFSGRVMSYAGWTTINQSGGVWEHLGQTDYDITTLNLYGGVFEMKSRFGTVTTFNGYNGIFDGTKTDQPYTFTNGNVYGGCDFRTNNNITHSNALVIYGGKYPATQGSITVTVPTPK